MSSNLALPIAIVLGCALIGAGLYFGLRSRPLPVVEPPPPPPVADPAEVTAAAGRALDATRSRMASACVPKGHAPVHLRFSMAFTATGAETARGISVLDGNAQDVGGCLREKFPPSLRIPPPGRGVSVEVRTELP